MVYAIFILMALFAVQMSLYLVGITLRGLFRLFLRVFLGIKPRDPFAGPPMTPEQKRTALTRTENYRRYRALRLHRGMPPDVTASGRWKTSRY